MNHYAINPLSIELFADMSALTPVLVEVKRATAVLRAADRSLPGVSDLLLKLRQLCSGEHEVVRIKRESSTSDRGSASEVRLEPGRALLDCIVAFESVKCAYHLDDKVHNRRGSEMNIYPKKKTPTAGEGTVGVDVTFTDDLGIKSI
ncbi:MAG: hypothetical protein M3H12_02400 [Chromatiales bacterium]|nr:hypothetical protein [Gammaproteobacteria bacterium]